MQLVPLHHGGGVGQRRDLLGAPHQGGAAARGWQHLRVVVVVIIVTVVVGVVGGGVSRC
jgi:hypothetical protein